MVWVPQGETVLGKLAGQWLRHTLLALTERKKKKPTKLAPKRDHLNVAGDLLFFGAQARREYS